MKTAMKKQTGFTLIELIMVIVILGILAATALPKFVNLGKDARVAAVKAVEASMRSANAIIYAKANIGNLMSSNTSVTVNGTATAIGYGYASHVTALAGVMDYSSDFTVSAASTSNDGAIYHAGATVPGANCGIIYTNAADATTAPTYTLSTTDC